MPEVRVDPRFRRYWRDGHYPNDVPSLYGTHYDTEWHFDESTHDWVPAEERPYRVFGAANWTDVRPEWPDVGKDYHLLGRDLDQPLDPIQMKMLNDHCGIKVKLGNLGFCMAFNPDEPAVIIPPSKWVGTPFYMSYEMKTLTAETQTDEVQLKPCDIFSLGVTLAECVMDWDDHNDNVKKGDLTNNMADKAKLSPNECPPGMTPLLASLIHSMIKKDPKDRPTIEEVLNHEWLREGTSRKRKEKSQSPDKKKFCRYRWHASI